MDNEQLNPAVPEDGEAPAKKPVRARRRKAAEPAEAAGPIQTAIPGTDLPEESAPPAEAAPAKPKTRRTRKAAAPAAEEAPADAAGQASGEAGQEPAEARQEPAETAAGQAAKAAPKARA